MQSGQVQTGDEILATLRRVGPELARRFTVSKIGLFGSWSRGEAKPTSDIDILVDLEQPTFDHFMDLKFCLEELFGRRVDLVTTTALRPALRKLVLRETRYAA